MVCEFRHLVYLPRDNSILVNSCSEIFILLLENLDFLLQYNVLFRLEKGSVRRSLAGPSDRKETSALGGLSRSMFCKVQCVVHWWVVKSG